MLHVRLTADSSPTLYDDVLDVTYHSMQGAWGETQYVFIEASELCNRFANSAEIQLLEIGFGTGLNIAAAVLAAQDFPSSKLICTSYEPHPLPDELRQAYYQHLPQVPTELHEALMQPVGNWHNAQWTVLQREWPDATSTQQFDIVFFDAFAPTTAPALWADGLVAAARQLKPGGVLVSYSVTGDNRRALTQAGLSVARLPGFGRKRHMLRAYK